MTTPGRVATAMRPGRPLVVAGCPRRPLKRADEHPNRTNRIFVPGSVDAWTALDSVLYYGVYGLLMSTGAPTHHSTQPQHAAPSLTVGQVAQQAGVGIETVRFYERESLLPEPPRTAAGYRQYTALTVERLQFIQRAKELGFSLRQTQELLVLRRDDARSAPRVRTRAQAKVDEITVKIRDLTAMRAQLTDLIGACAERPSDAACPILVALDGQGRVP